MSDERYLSDAQQRLLRVLLALAGNEFLGVAPGELARAAATLPSNITRDLANLKAAGLAEEVEPGRWRLGPKLIQIALAFSRHVGRMSDRLDELQQRYTRLP